MRCDLRYVCFFIGKGALSGDKRKQWTEAEDIKGFPFLRKKASPYFDIEIWGCRFVGILYAWPIRMALSRNQ